MILKLKPHWCLRTTPDRASSLTSENYHQEFGADYYEILQAAFAGVDPQSLDDQDFDRLQFLINSGFVVDEGSPDSTVWDLSGVNFHTVQEQIKHVTFHIVDQTPNKVGDSIRQGLLDAGFKESVTPKIVIVVNSSYQTLSDMNGMTMLPVVCNRLRVTVGPVVFPWTASIRKTVLRSKQYLPHPDYVLPPVFDQLQRAWLSVAVLQFLAANKLRYVSNFVEYDMGKQEFKVWPSK